MSQINFPILNTPDKNLQLIQANIQKAIVAIQQSPFIGGVLLTSISLTGGQDNLIAHKLGRIPQIFTVGMLGVNSVIWSPVSTNLLDSRGTAVNANSSFINLRCSTSCTISLWVN